MGRLRRVFGTVACAAVLGFVLAGCGERPEPTGSTVPNAYPVTVQGANDEAVVVEHAPVTVLPVSASAAAIVEALGRRSLVPGAHASRPLRAFPVAAVAKTPADLVIGSQENDALALDRAAQRSNVPVLVIADGSILDLERSILDVGLAIGAPVKARQLVAAIDAKLASIKGRLKGVAPTTVFVDTGFLIPVSNSTFAGELLRVAGGKNVADDAESTPFPIKALRAANPSFFLATDTSGTTLADLRKTPRLKSLTAVRKGRVAVIPERLLQPTPALADAVGRIAAILHPDALR